MAYFSRRHFWRGCLSSRGCYCSTSVKGAAPQRQVSIGNPRITEATCTLQSTAVGSRTMVARSNIVVPKSNIVVSCTAQSFGVVIASHTKIMTARLFGGCY